MSLQQPLFNFLPSKRLKVISYIQKIVSHNKKTKHTQILFFAEVQQRYPTNNTLKKKQHRKSTSYAKTIHHSERKIA